MRNRVEIKSDAKQLIRVSRVSPLVMSALLVIITFVLERLPMLAGFPFFTAKYVQTCLDAMVTGSYAAVDEMIHAAAGEPILLFPAHPGLAGYPGSQQRLLHLLHGNPPGHGHALQHPDGWAGRSREADLVLGADDGAAFPVDFAVYRLSCQQTYGVKMELFILDLSFIGWNLLVPFTFGVLNIWLIPYMTLCDIAYFEDAQNRLGRSFFSGNGWEL